jgi:hypothetical protein
MNLGQLTCFLPLFTLHCFCPPYLHINHQVDLDVIQSPFPASCLSISSSNISFQSHFRWFFRCTWTNHLNLNFLIVVTKSRFWYIHIYMYLYIYIYTHTHTHIHLSSWLLIVLTASSINPIFNFRSAMRTYNLLHKYPNTNVTKHVMFPGDPAKSCGGCKQRLSSKELRNFNANRTTWITANKSEALQTKACVQQMSPTPTPSHGRNSRHVRHFQFRFADYWPGYPRVHGLVPIEYWSHGFETTAAE